MRSVSRTLQHQQQSYMALVLGAASVLPVVACCATRAAVLVAVCRLYLVL